MDIRGDYRRISHEDAVRRAIAEAFKEFAEGIAGGESNVIWTNGMVESRINHRYPLPRTIRVTIEHTGDNYTAYLTITEEATL